MSALGGRAAVFRLRPEPPLIAEAVEELGTGGRVRNNGIGSRRRVNHYCLQRRLDESLLRASTLKIVFQQPQPRGDIQAFCPRVDFHMAGR